MKFGQALWSLMIDLVWNVLLVLRFLVTVGMLLLQFFVDLIDIPLRRIKPTARRRMFESDTL